MQTVNGREEALAALAMGEHELASPPYAACHAGVGYYEALIAELRGREPGLRFTLCCGDDPATAHEALRRGLSPVRCAVEGPAAQALTALAQELGAEFLQG